MPDTYCNPLPLPDYQVGRECPRASFKGRHFREMADPTVVRFKGRWYLFPSAGMLWHSDDMLTWTHHRIEPFDPGYAPTVVVHGDWLFMSSSWDGSAIWRARDPLGPWERLGERGLDEDGNPTWLRDHTGRPVRWGDPCLFSDDDGELYCYCNLALDHVPSPDHPWRLKPAPGAIFGVRLRRDDPTRFAEAARELIAFNPGLHPWEATGTSNQDHLSPVLEGAWLNKHGGSYYLQYSANGTEFRNYALGCYRSESPLGPFRPQRRNPILVGAHGLVNGCAHHSVVTGPDGGLWCFYTCRVRIDHPMERRIGMDPVRFTAEGEMYVDGPSDTPRLAPAAGGGRLGLVALSVDAGSSASSERDGHPAFYAFDDSIRTWWQAVDSAQPQWLDCDLHAPFETAGARVMFADRGLDLRTGVVPGPYRYRILGRESDRQEWSALVDRSGNAVDRHIAYETWPARRLRHVRLEILAAPPGMAIAVWQFTVFGRPHGVAATPG